MLRIVVVPYWPRKLYSLLPIAVRCIGTDLLPGLQLRLLLAYKTSPKSKGLSQYSSYGSLHQGQLSQDVGSLYPKATSEQAWQVVKRGEIAY